jgi:hypothetical protein
MASNSSEEHAKLNECKASLTKYVTAIKRDFRKNPKGVIGALIVLLLSCALSFAVAVNIATGNSIFGFAPRTEDHWNQRIELKGMDLSQDQVIHSEAHGDMFYVDGQIDGKPELFVYYRYVDDRGVVQDKLTPRKDVELVEDLPTGAAAVVEFNADYTRVMTTSEVEARYKPRDISVGDVFGVMFINQKKATPEKQPRPCFTEVETCDTKAKKSDTKPRISIHLPKGAIIKHIDPNTIHRGGK